LTIKLAMVCFGLLALLLVFPGCGNGPGCQTDADCGGAKCLNGQCMQCSVDSDCNANDACMVCAGGACQKQGNCCTTDLQCGAGNRCWNVKGKAYGKCGPANAH
jgi:hypothetical protein